MQAHGASVHLRLSAAAVTDDAGRRGWLASVELEFTAAMMLGDRSHAFGKIARAGLRCGTAQVPRLSIPGKLAGDIDLVLEFANGTRVVVKAQALALSVADDARFTEDASC